MGFELPDKYYKINDNPYISCGYGINSFLENLKFLRTIMLILTIFAIPIFLIYNQMGG